MNKTCKTEMKRFGDGKGFGKSLKRTAALFAAGLAALLLASCEKHVPEDYVKLVDNGVTSYTVVRSDNSDIGASAAAKLRKALLAISDSDVKIITDFEHEKLGTMRTDFEILVGPTNREESGWEPDEPFTYYDYEIRFDEDSSRPAINGGSSAALDMAVDYLLENYYDASAKTFALPKGKIAEHHHDYPIDSLTLGGTPIEDCVIVSVPGDERAEKFAKSFLPLYGKRPRVEKAGYKDPSDCEIVLSSAGDERYADVFSSLSDFEYMYKIEGTRAFIGGNGVILDDDEAWDMFVAEQFGNDFNLLAGDIALTDCENACEIPAAPRYEADDAFIAEVDAKADALRESILNTPNMKIPEDALCYYVSENGDDANDGLTPETAWRSLSKVNSFPATKPCYVLFERGGVWRGQIKARENMTYTAYGEGAKPCLYGSPLDGADPALWSLLPGTEDIWVFGKDMMDSGALFINGGEYITYKEIPSYIGGKFVKRNAPSEDFDIAEALDNDLDFFCAACSNVNDDMPVVSSADCVGKVYLKCSAGNPGEVFDSIEFAPRANGFAVGGNNVHIDNFTIKYVGSHGIGSGTRNGLVVTNCELGCIGGGIQGYNANGKTDHSVTRYGNAIEIYGGCDGYTVNHCYIYQIYDAGITPQYSNRESDSLLMMENMDFSENLIEYCVYSIEFFHTVPNSPESRMKNYKIHDNIMRFAGFGWGNQRPDFGSQAHIKGWGHVNPSEDFVIYNNIFDRSGVMMVDTAFAGEEDKPVFRDNVFIQYEAGTLSEALRAAGADLDNVLVQYEFMSFGTFGQVPDGTGRRAYSNAIRADGNLMDNEFRFLPIPAPLHIRDSRETAVMREIANMKPSEIEALNASVGE